MHATTTFTQNQTGKNIMTARQFWKENFPDKKATIFEVMEAYAELKLQDAHAQRLNEATKYRTEIKTLEHGNGKKEINA